MSRVKTALRTPLLPLVLPLVWMLQGCGPTRVVLVPPGAPVRLAEPVKAKVWARDANGAIVQSRNRVIIPEGWYALPQE